MPVSSTLLNTISQRIVAALQAQQSQDGWSEYAKSRFSLVESLERLQPGIAQALQSETPEEVEAKLQGLVQKLFSGQFVLSQEGQDLLSQCYSLLLPDIQAGLLAAEASVVQEESRPELPEANSEDQVLEDLNSTAMVLLDADNLSLDLYHEQYLQKQLNCDINYRIAFANWKHKTSDANFYSRHYVLIHVPSGQDLADGAMLVFGSSIQKHYPDVDQVFIASNDKIFTSLATSLVQQKYKVYHITQNGEKVTVQNIKTGERWGLPKPPIPIGHLIQRVKDLYHQLKGDHFWVTLESLDAAYAQTHGVDFVEELADRIDGNTLLAFLQKYPQNFVVHYTDPQAGPFWFALFNQPAAQNDAGPTQEANATVSAEAEVPLVSLSGHQGVAQFEAQLVGLVKKLMKEKPERVQDGSILFGDLCAAYKQQYGQAVNDVSTAITGKRLLAFLQHSSSKKIHLHLKDKVWYLGV